METSYQCHQCTFLLRLIQLNLVLFVDSFVKLTIHSRLFCSRRYGSPPRRFRSPRGSIRFEPGRSEAGLKFSSHRGGSAPRSTPKVDPAERQHESDGNKLEVEPDSKSKSLPPKNETEVSREEEERQRLETVEQKRLEFEERLRRLPTPGMTPSLISIKA